MRLRVLPPLWRGALVVVIGVGVSTCRIGDLLTVPEGGLLYTIPGPDQGADSVLAGSAEFGSTANHVMKIFVGHTGKGQLDWSATIGGASPWLTITNKTGSSGDSISVVGNPIGLDTGTHRDSIIVSSNAGGTIVVPVRFDIDTCAVTSLQSSGDEKVDSLKTSNCGAPHHSGTQARLFSFTANSGELATVLLSASFNGYLALDTSATAAPLLTATDCQGDTKNPCIYYFHLPRTTTYIIEVTGATSADIGEFKVRLLRTSRPPNLADSLDQRRVLDSSSVTVGDTVRATTVLFRAAVSDSDVVDALHLEAEAQPINTNFTGAPTAIGQPVVNGQPAWVSQSVITGISYHWCVKVVDQTGSGSACLPFGGNADSPLPAATDFVVKTGSDPNPPTNLKQLQSDGSTAIPTGQTANGTTVVFQGDISDLDAGNTVQLQVEVQPIDSDFTGQPTEIRTSALLPNPSTGVQVSVNAPKLANGKSYHWRARTLDNTGLPSNWVMFGGNADLPLPAATDFNVQVLPTNLVITVQPVVDTSGRPIHPNVQVTAKDQNNNTITTFVGPVTMAITPFTGDLTATLSGTNPVNAQSGVATFTNLSINKAAAGYRLQASAVIGGNTITSAPSTAFNVLPGPGAKLAFTTQPTNTVAGQTIAPVVVAVQDTASNTDTSYSGTVTVAITAGTGKPGAPLNGTKTVAVANGLATFSTLSIDSAATGYTLTATSTGLTSATSAAFAINPGAGNRLQFTVQPSNAAATAFITPTVKVTAYDVKGNVATGFTGNVTLTITSGTGTAGATPSGNGPLAAVAGVASFPSLSIDKVGSGYTLTAASTGLTSGTSTPFNITNSGISPTLSTLSALPAIISASNGSSASTITVTARDNTGQPVSGATVLLSATGSGNTLTQPGGPTDVNGVATGTLSSTGSGPKIVSATINTLPINQTDTVTVNAGAATLLVFTPPPSTTTAGVAINSPTGVVVTARDQFGNTATTFTATLNMTIAAGPPGGTFAPTSVNSAPAVSGVAQFLGLRIYKAGSGYQIQASGGGLNVTSGTFNINAAPPFQLAFTTQPQTTAVLAKIDSAVGGVVVTVQDSVGNTTPFGGTVRVIVGNPGTNPGGGTLSNGSAITAPTGIATFQNLTLDKLGTGYTLQTTSSGPVLQPDESTPFNIIPGPATTLTFTTQPTNTVAGALIDSVSGVQVTAFDAHGFVATSFTGNITVAIGTNPSGGTLSGTKVVSAALGVATFTTLRINNVGTGYTLTASATGLSIGTSQPFNILQGGVSASQSTVFANPTTITACKTGCSAGAGTASTITVTAKDAQGNGVAGATVTLASTSTSANITQPSGVTNSAGQIAGTVSDTTTGSQTITATVTLSPNPPVQITLPATVSVNAAAPAAAQFLRNPTTTTSGAIITPATGVQVQIVDQFGNRTNATSTVNLSILVPPSPGGATLFGTNPKNAVNGVATFSDLHIDKAGIGYQLLAQSTNPTVLVSDSSTRFDITSGTATKLGFVQQPTSENGGVAITPAVTVEVEDVNGNRVTSATNSITMAIGFNANNGSLGGTKTVSASSGLAQFSNLSIDSAGTGYTLAASASGLTGTTSSAFNITVGSAAKLGFHVQPSNTPGGASITPAVVVEVQDLGGNRVTSANNTVSVAIGTNPGGGSLSGNAPVAAVSGLATFPNLSIDKSGSGYTLTSASTGLSGATSATFNITTGAATKLGFVQQPTQAGGGATITPAVTVEVEDAGGNRVTSAINSITVAIGTNANNGSLGGLKTVAATSGLAQFSNLSIDSAGTGYTLTASASGLTGATSNNFNITVGAANKLGFLIQPSSSTGGATITPGVQVEIRDAGGNRVTTATNSVTVAIGTNPNSGTLSGLKTQAASGGVATFSNLSIDSAGPGYTLTASTSGLSGATSSAFTISVGAATKLGFRVQPNNPTGGVAFSPNVQVEVRDAGGNRVTSASTSIQLTLNGGDAAATLSGSNPISANSGLATFSGLSVDSAANNYTLVATGGGLTQATSTLFNVTVGPAAKLGFHIQPSNAVAGATISQVQVELEDAGGNRVTTNGTTIVVAIANNPGGGTLGGTTSKNTSSGLATYNNLNINKTGTGYTLQATSGSLTQATSTGFDITPAAADHLAFIVQPSNTIGGQTITPAVVVEVRDQFDNLVTGATTQITVAIGNNPGIPAGTLAGTLVVNAVSGQATFGDLSIDNAGVGYTLTASAASLTGDTSAQFDIL
jgi:hypothetical protein